MREERDCGTAIIDATLLEAAGAEIEDHQATLGGDLQVPVVPDGEAQRSDRFMCSVCHKFFP